MADLALTKIFDKMPNGGTAIGGNFDSVKAVLGPLAKETAPKQMIILKGTTNGANPAVYWRKDNIVFLGGGVTGDIKENDTLWQVPVGFRPCASMAFAGLIKQQYPTATAMLLFHDTGVTQVLQNDGTGAIWLDGIWWPTDDDFPS